ncbi:MAG: DinB family protein [Bryobacteraceae bacterium]
MVRLEHVLDSWRTIRQDTAAAVEDFPAGELDFRATPEVAPFGEIARHILEAGEGLTGLLLAGDEDFTVPDFRERLKRHATSLPADASAADIAAALRQSLDQRLAELAARPPEFFAHIITRFDGQRLTRLEMVQTIKEHELTHRAQLFLYLRLKGIVPATTRRRMAKQGAK